jgi:hypothetical protein
VEELDVVPAEGGRAKAPVRTASDDYERYAGALALVSKCVDEPARREPPLVRLSQLARQLEGGGRVRRHRVSRERCGEPRLGGKVGLGDGNDCEVAAGSAHDAGLRRGNEALRRLVDPDEDALEDRFGPGRQAWRMRCGHETPPKESIS